MIMGSGAQSQAVFIHSHPKKTERALYNTFSDAIGQTPRMQAVLLVFEQDLYRTVIAAMQQ
jgi:hypothetical protein